MKESIFTKEERLALYKEALYLLTRNGRGYICVELGHAGYCINPHKVGGCYEYYKATYDRLDNYPELKAAKPFYIPKNCKHGWFRSHKARLRALTKIIKKMEE